MEEIKSTLLNDEDMAIVKKSLLHAASFDNIVKFRVKTVEYIDVTAADNGDQFFYDMLNHLRFLEPDDETTAYTTPDKLIYVNCPGKFGEKIRTWDFVYCHECLHQLWNTFKVGEKIQKEGLEFSPYILNIASDCVINDYLDHYRKKEKPEFGIYPDVLKEQYGVVYDRKKDTQYSLYLKLLEKKEELMKDTNLRKQCDEDFGGKKLTPKKITQSNQPMPDIPNKPTITNITDDFIKGWTDAIKDALDKKVDPLTYKPKKGSDDYTKGYNAAMENMKKGLEQGIELNTSNSNISQQTGLPDIPWDLPAPQNNGDSSSSSSAQQSANDAKESAQKAADAAAKAQKAADAAKDAGNNSDAAQTAQDKAEKAKEAAEKAADAADKAQKAADAAAKAEGKGDAQGAADAAQEAADAAKEAADAANEAGAGQSKLSDMSAEEAASAAKEAAEAAKEAAKKAEAAAKSTKGQGASDAKEEAEKAKEAAEKADAAAKAAEKAAKAGDTEAARKAAQTAIENNDMAQQDAQRAEDIRDGKMAQDSDANSSDKTPGTHMGQHTAGKGHYPVFETPEELDKLRQEADELIKQYAKKLSGDLGKFINQCKISAELKKDGLIAPTVNRANSGWNTKMTQYINGYVKKRVFQKKRQFQSTYSRVKRGSGFIKFGEPIEPGKKIKEDKLNIDVAFYVDRSGSMSSCLSQVFDATYVISDILSKHFGKDPVVDKLTFKIWSFDTEMKELKWGHKCNCGGGTMSFDEILDFIDRHTKDFLINVIITDGQFEVNQSKAEELVEQLGGMLMFITNCATPGVKKIANKYNTKVFYIEADANFTIDK